MANTVIFKREPAISSNSMFQFPEEIRNKEQTDEKLKYVINADRHGISLDEGGFALAETEIAFWMKKLPGSIER